jgi:uncharacterized membrane protein YsdA (DUF1294 family)
VEWPRQSLLVGWLALVNVIGFVVAWKDKRAARRGDRRTPENTLLLSALIGAWPLMFVAFALFHHKTGKPRFLVPFVLCSAANLAVLLFLARP